jgi:hypothetical protein
LAAHLLLAISAVAGRASATTFTWTGARDGDWSTVFIAQTNWAGNVVPTSSASNDLVFSASVTTTSVNNDISSPFLLNSLTFGGSAFTLSGGTLELVADGATAPKISVNTATSQTIFNPMNFANAVTVGGSGTGSIAFRGTITGAGSLTDNVPTTLGGGSAVLTGGQNYSDAVTLTSNMILTSTGSGTLSFGSSLNGAHALTLNTAGVTTIGGTVGNTSALTSLTTNAAGSTTLSGGSITTTGAQTFNDPVNLASGATLSSTNGGNISFATTVNGAGSLIVITAGTVTFGGAVGSPSALSSLLTQGGGTTAINGGTVTTSGVQIYTGPVMLGANTTLASSTDDIILDQGASGAFSLGLNSGQLTELRGGVNVASLSTNSPGSTAINGGSVTTTSGQFYNDPVTLGANTTLTSTGSGSISLANAVNGPFSLTVNTPGTTTLGAVGVGTALTSLTTDAAGATNLSGGSVVTTGAQSYNDAVTLGAATTLTSTAAGNVTFGGTINGAFPLTINTAVTTRLGGAVGGSAALASFKTDFGGSTAINGGSVKTTGAQNYGDPVTLGANTTLTSTGGGDLTFALSVNGGFDLTLDTTGNVSFSGPVGNSTSLTSLLVTPDLSTAINGGAVTTRGGQSWNGPVTLGAHTTLTSTGAGNITLSAAVNGGFGLTVNTAGTMTLGGAVGATTALVSLTTDAPGTTRINGGSVKTTGAQSYNDAVTIEAATIGGATTLTSTGAGNISFASTVNGPVPLRVNTAGTTTLGGAVGGGAALASLTTDGAGGTQINGGGVTTFLDQTYGDAVTLGANTMLTSTLGGNISLVTVNGAFGLTLNTAGTTSFLGAIGGSAALTSLTTDAAGLTMPGGSVTTTGAQSYNDPVSLTAVTTMTSTGAGDISFASTVNGPVPLTVNTAGTTTLGGAVGGSAALVSLTTDAPGTTALNGGAVTTSGAQSYNDPVTLGADTTLTSTGSGNISFASTINGGFALTTNTAGTMTLDGAVGGATALASLTTQSAGTTALNGGAVTTSGGQTYGNAVTLGADTTLTSTGGGNIALAKTVNGGFGLTINTTGTTTLGGALGGTAPLTSMSAGGGAIIMGGGAVTTSGAQNWNGPVTLTADTTLRSTGSGNIGFASTLDGGFGLTLATGGTSTLSGAVGGTTPLASLTTNASSITASTVIGGGSITTSGAQTYNAPVTLGGATTLTSTAGGNISFDLGIGGAFPLTINTSGTTSLSRIGLVNIASLMTDAAGLTQIQRDVRTTGNQFYGDAVEITFPPNNLATLSSTGGGNITFAGSVNREFLLTVTTTGQVTFGGPVGNLTQLSRLTVNAGNILMNGGGVTTHFDQQYTGNMTLGAATTFTQTGNPGSSFMAFGAINGGFPLTLNPASRVAFNSTVGVSTPLQSITINDATTDLPTQAITTGSQTYNGAADTNLSAALTSLGGDITFGGGLDATFNLSVTAATGTITFAAPVGGSIPPQSLTFSAQDVTGTSVTAHQITQSSGGGTTTFTGLLHSTRIPGISLTGSNFSLADVTVDAGTLSMNVSGTGTISGPVAGNANLIKSGPGVLTLSASNGYTGATTVSDGTLRVGGSVAPSTGVTVNNSATFDAAAVQTVRALTINNTAKAVVSAGSLKIGDGSTANPLSIAAGAPGIDLTTHGMILDYSPGNQASAFNSVRGLIISGLGTGTWNGQGILSSNAAADSSKGVGYAQASDILGAAGGTFLGQSADGTSILARYTLLADATLDGVVDFNDLVRLAQNYNVTDGTRLWFTGDFNYDGNTDFNDLVKLAQNYNGALPATPVAGAPAGFASDLQRAFASVPEPAAAAMPLLAGSIAFVRPRKRR